MTRPGLDALLRAGLSGRRVLLRADLNAPLAPARTNDGRMRVADDARLCAALGSLRRLLAAGARVVLVSHLGRPRGAARAELTLRPVAARLGELLGRAVAFCAQCVGAEAEAAVAALKDGEVLLLENLRFHPGETRNEPAFAAALARHADCYVNDAFGAAHRAHASVVGVAARIRTRAAGDLLLRELRELDAVRKPERPLLCLIGGAKVSDKLGVLHALARHADALCVGGAMAYTFLRARGESVGRSLLEAGRVDDARAVAEAAAAAGCALELPSDHVVAPRCEAGAATRVVERIPGDCMALDIGPQSAARYQARVQRARTVFWNGPMGCFELDAFAQGTNAVARALAASPAHSIVGGGDSLAAIRKLGLGAQIGHLSTGGGAALEYIQGRTLPGVAALLEDATHNGSMSA